MENRIYVACLASYNDGRLHGAWIDLSTDPEEMSEAINAMLRASPCPNVTRQEYRDENGNSRMVDVTTPAGKIPDDWEKVGEPFASADGERSEDFGATLEAIKDNFSGAWPSLQAWVEDLEDQTGEIGKLPERLRNYIDFEAMARDVKLSGDVLEIEHAGESFIFWNH